MVRSLQVVPPGYFLNIDANTDPLLGMYWPAERPVDLPVTLDVGPGRAFATVQAAVDWVPAESSRRTLIRIQPGTYREAVRVPSNRPRISFIGQGTLAPQAAHRSASTGRTSLPGTLTISNDFDEAANTGIKDRQAVALHITGDRSVLSNVRCLGNEDTLLVNSPEADVPARFYFDGTTAT